MQEFHCYHAHPDFPEKKCNAKIEALFHGDEVFLRCWRCLRPVRFTAKLLDKEPVLALG